MLRRAIAILMTIAWMTETARASDWSGWRVEVMGGAAHVVDVATGPTNNYTGLRILPGPPICTPWDCGFPTETYQHPFTRPNVSVLGVSLTAGAALWHDFQGFSAGLEYAFVRGSKTYEKGETFWGRMTTSGAITETTSVHALMANIAKNFSIGNRFRPYVGGGVGIGWRSTDFDYSPDYEQVGWWTLREDRIPPHVIALYPRTLALDGSAPGIAYQLFAGINMDLTDRVYLGARAAWFGHYAQDVYMPDTLFTDSPNASLHFGALRATVNLGVRF
ncbi:hypothetical protein [Stappia sp.]|uniref:hypothetical protein n=1 Tax=Stappia sp. TaxID=1870903 RepID=UPI003C7B3E58